MRRLYLFSELFANCLICILAPLKHIWDYESFARAFLYVYLSFADPPRILELIIERFRKVIQFSDCWDLRVKFAIIAVLKEWINVDNGGDFASPAIRQALYSFVQSEAKGVLETPLTKLLALLDPVSERVASKDSVPPALLPAKPEPVLITDVNPIEVARQMTLIEVLYALQLIIFIIHFSIFQFVKLRESLFAGRLIQQDQTL